MLPQSVDYVLGQQLQSRLAQIAPLTLQQLLALLSDLSRDDIELVSAIRLLSSRPIFADSLLSCLPVQPPQLASIYSIANDTLSPGLVQRVQDLISGYNSVFTIPKPADISPYLQQNYFQEPTVVADIPSPRSDEPATLFAEAAGDHGGSSDPQPPLGVAPQSSNSGLPIAQFLKPILIILALSSSVFCLFRVKALCEPLGLCEASKSDEKKNDESPSSVQERPAGPVAMPSNSASSQSTPAPSSGSAAPPSRQEPQLREEPLW